MSYGLNICLICFFCYFGLQFFNMSCKNKKTYKVISRKI
nr:MAG TPA: hypothetical protein [Caudoviricetes sp.]